MATPTAAQDKLGVCNLVVDGVTLKYPFGQADSAQNGLAAIQTNWNGSGDGIVLTHNAPWLSGRIPPTTTDYANAPIGSLYFEFKADSDQTPTIYDADLWIRKRYGWEKVRTVYQTDVTLSNANILALHTTPIELVAAPGAGKVLVLENVIGRHIVAGTPAAFANIVAGDDLNIRYTDGSGGIAATLETTGWLDTTADALQYAAHATSVKPVANAALVASLGGAIDTGTGTIKLRLRYRVEPSSF